jgi:hypothetical protein
VHRISRRKAETTIDRIFQEVRAATNIPAINEPSSAPVATTVTGAPAAVEAQLPDHAEAGSDTLPLWMQLSDGRFSPELLAEGDVAKGVQLVDEEEDRVALMNLRRQVLPPRRLNCWPIGCSMRPPSFVNRWTCTRSLSLERMARAILGTGNRTS